MELVVQVDDGAGRGNPVTRVSDMIGRRCDPLWRVGESRELTYMYVSSRDSTKYNLFK